MTPDEIRNHPLFEKLTDRQQIFVSALLENGNDKVAAAHKAWNCSSDESARTLANRNMQNESVAFLVEQYFGKDPEHVAFTREKALDFAAKKARYTKDDKLALEYLKLIAAMQGWLTKSQDKVPDQPRDDSDDPFSLE